LRDFIPYQPGIEKMSITVTIVLVLVATALLICLQFALAPTIAAWREVKQVRVLGGLAKYVLWESNEVVIFQRGGKVLGELLKRDIEDGQGGARFIFALRGESVRGRVWLGVQSWTWGGQASTREGIPCTLKAAVKFSVEDVSKFVYGNKATRPFNKLKEIDASRIAASLFSDDVEECVVSTLSQESLIRMIILKLPAYLQRQQDGVASEAVTSSVAEISAKLAKIIGAKLAESAGVHGMLVHGVTVPSMQFAPEIVKKALATVLTMFEPLQAEQLAEADRIVSDTKAASYAKGLADIKSVLGLEVTQIRELLQHLPDGSDNGKEELVKGIISGVKSLNSKREVEELEAEADAAPPKSLNPNNEPDEE
jgi:regulator of protease activity HflC (stomatin/prohibitin superfamily)